MRPDIRKAITVLGFVDTSFTSTEKGIEEWDISLIPTGEIQPTQAAIAAKLAELEAEYDSQQYARDRATAYPPMADQLDDIFHNGVAGWKKTIQAVKDTHPKP